MASRAKTNVAAPAVASGLVAFSCVDIRKTFGGVQALIGASLSAVPREVHALVGENGAGKSTLIKALGGRLRPDSGAIEIKGRPVAFARPEDAHTYGVRTVFQELTLLPWMTVAENLLIGREPRGPLGLIRRRRTEQEAEALLVGVGVDHIDPLALVEDLSLAERQVIEIVRAINAGPEILLLDEPSSSLVEREVKWLFGQIRKLRDAGVCVIFTSHRWNEIRDIADRITVFRGGRHVGTFTEIDESDAVTLMTGRRGAFDSVLFERRRGARQTFASGASDAGGPDSSRAESAGHHRRARCRGGCQGFGR